jgi:hypothetical protein
MKLLATVDLDIQVRLYLAWEYVRVHICNYAVQIFSLPPPFPGPSMADGRFLHFVYWRDISTRFSCTDSNIASPLVLECEAMWILNRKVGSPRSMIAEISKVNLRFSNFQIFLCAILFLMVIFLLHYLLKGSLIPNSLSYQTATLPIRGESALCVINYKEHKLRIVNDSASFWAEAITLNFEATSTSCCEQSKRFWSDLI